MYPKNRCSETPSRIPAYVLFLDLSSALRGTDWIAVQRVRPHESLTVLVSRRLWILVQNRRGKKAERVVWSADWHGGKSTGFLSTSSYCHVGFWRVSGLGNRS